MSLHNVTESILIEMASSALWKNLKEKRGYTGEPTAWDINCGYCDTWAETVAESFGGEAVWLDTLNEKFGDKGLDVRHCVIVLNGRYYDSQHPNGVDSHWDMDIVNKVSREAFLAKDLARR